MNRLLKVPNLLTVCRKDTQRLASSRATQDIFHQPDATPEQIRLVNERAKLRKALKAEYIRKVTDPHCTEPIVFNPTMQRYYTLHMTVTERFIPTFKNWCAYMITCIVPIIILGLYLKHSRNVKERRIRSGEFEYKDRFFKFE